MRKYCNIVKNKLNSLIRNMEKNSSAFVAEPKRDFVRSMLENVKHNSIVIADRGYEAYNTMALRKKFCKFKNCDKNVII